MSQRIGIMWFARLCRCTMYSLACGRKDWKQRDWHSECTEAVCSDELLKDGTNMQLCSFWVYELGFVGKEIVSIQTGCNLGQGFIRFFHSDLNLVCSFPIPSR